MSRNTELARLHAEAAMSEPTGSTRFIIENNALRADNERQAQRLQALDAENERLRAQMRERMTTDAYEALLAELVRARDTEYASKLEDKGARLNAIEAVLIELLELLIDERRVDG